MHEWTGLSRGRALAVTTARDPREFPVGLFHRDPVPPPNVGPGAFMWFADDAEAADFMVEVVPRLLLDPDSWPDFDELVASTREVVQGVPAGSIGPMDALRELGPYWASRAHFVWWGTFDEFPGGATDFGRLVRLQYLEHIDAPDGERDLADDEIDAFIHFMRVYPD
ncbi:MAG: hypothetical protein KGQ95_00460 [Acidobacteria bacterium]|nr:hypothetical protein [Acidobacteriota bacterium]